MPGAARSARGDALVRVYEADFLRRAASDQSERSWPEERAGRWRRRRPASALAPTLATLVGDSRLIPDSPPLDRQVSSAEDDSGDPVDGRGLGRARAAERRRRTSTPAPRTPRASSGECCATRSSRPRATASGSSRPSNAPSRSTRPERRVFRHRAVPVLRGRSSGGGEGAAVLLMLPGGSKTEGMARIKRARAHRGRSSRGRADYQLQILYLWYERRADLAVDSSSRCGIAIPGNPLFASQLADIQDRYLHDTTGQPRVVAGAAGPPRATSACTRRSRGGAGPAGHRAQRRGRRPDRPRAGTPSSGARRQAGEARRGDGRRVPRARRGRRPPRAPRRGDLGLPPGDERQPGVRSAGAPPARGRPDEAHAGPGPRRSVPPSRWKGLRKLEKADSAAPSPLLARSVLLEPKDGVAPLSPRPVLAGKKDDAAALASFEGGDPRAARDCPPPIVAAAYLEAARLHDGSREERRRSTTTPRGEHALRRRRRDTRRGESRSAPPSRRQIDRFGGTGPPSRRQVDRFGPAFARNATASAGQAPWSAEKRSTDPRS
jgi:hypothetical protein